VTRLIRAAERCFAVAMRIVPRQHRFQTVLLLARATVPLLVRTTAYREQSIKNFHRPDEIVLFLLLNALTKNGTRFDLEIVAKGYQHFERAFAHGKGVLVTGHHAALTLLMVRFFHDKDLQPVVITPDSNMRVPGTSVSAETIQPSHMFLVHLRTQLRAGKLLCAMPDRAEHHGQRTIEFATPAGPVIMAPAIIEVAARSGAAVLFTEVRVEGRKLVTMISEPASGAGDASAIIKNFISFVRERTAAANGASGSQTSRNRFRLLSLLANRR
jgi:lauroyl/myristoyl acyltransferase